MGVDMLFILLLALILFGPKRLPEIARHVGKFVAEFKRASNDFKYQIQAEIDKADTGAPAASRPSTPEAGALGTPSSPSAPALLPPAESSPAPYDAGLEHERLIRTARMAYQAQAFSLRPPEPPPVAHSTPLPAAEPSPAEPVSAPSAASPAAAGDPHPQGALPDRGAKHGS